MVLLSNQARLPPPINYRRRHCPMLRSHRTHFSFGIYFLYHRMGGHHVIPKCSPHDVYVAFLLPFKVRMQCLHYSARTEERVVADPSKPKTNRDERLCTFMWLCVASAWFETPAGGTAELDRPWANGRASIWQRNKKCDKWAVLTCYMRFEACRSMIACSGWGHI